MKIENSRLRFLLPGLKLKRYVILIILSILLLMYGIFVFSTVLSQNEYFMNSFLYPGKYFDVPFEGFYIQIVSVLVIIASIILLYIGISLLVQSVAKALVPDKPYEEIMNLLFERRKESLKKRVVNIGGGTGTTAVLEGLRGKFLKISAVITVADSGGSSGRLRRELNVPPPGDIRNCLLALTDENSLARKILSYRFNAPNSCLDGHNLGNILIAGLTKVTNDFGDAVLKLSKLLNIDGEVLPFTEDEAILCAEFEDGEIVEGEAEITERGKKIKRVFLKNGEIKPYLPALERILNADVIVIGPGSLFTSIMPPLLIPSIVDTIRRSNAIKIYVVNAMTEHGETDGFTASHHVKVIVDTIGDGVLNYAVINTKEFSKETLSRYKLSNSEPVIPDVENVSKLGVKPILGYFAKERGGLIRHDPEALGEIIMKLVQKRA
ncbi:MAG: gluconeogenesis factor YvcK family protein [Caldisericum sp.]